MDILPTDQMAFQHTWKTIHYSSHYLIFALLKLPGPLVAQSFAFDIDWVARNPLQISHIKRAKK